MSRHRPWIHAAIGRGLGVLIGLGLFGYIFRDRSVVMGLLFYIPLLPIGLGMGLWDLLHRGRSLRPLRFGGTVLGLLAILLGAYPMIAWGPASHAPVTGDQSPLRLLQWNVMWGRKWSSTQEAILARQPDIVVLSEAGPVDQTEALRARLGAEWSIVRRTKSREGCLIQSALLSRWPARFEEDLWLTNGVITCIVIDHPAGPLRVLIADGESHPLLPRTGRLTQIMDYCEQAARDGRPIDIIAGDFNTPGRAVGFDQFHTRAGGWTLASRSTSGWRATWPAFCPLYDIDHVWLNSRHAVALCTLYSATSTDHRGQVVQIHLTTEPATP